MAEFSRDMRAFTFTVTLLAAEIHYLLEAAKLLKTKSGYSYTAGTIKRQEFATELIREVNKMHER